MVESNIQPKRLNILPWIIGLVLLVLAICGLAAVADRNPAGTAGHGTATTDAQRDDTPPRLRQYALAVGIPASLPERSLA